SVMMLPAESPDWISPERVGTLRRIPALGAWGPAVRSRMRSAAGGLGASGRTGGVVTARHRVALSEAADGPSVRSVGPAPATLPPTPAEPVPATGPPLRRPVAAILNSPRSIGARLGRILALSLTMTLLLLGLLLGRQVGDFRSAASAASTVR